MKPNSERLSRKRSLRTPICSVRKRRKTRGDFTPMLLRTSIYSSTKKFFQKTVENFKSFVSGGYQRLPKSPPCDPISRSNGVDINFDQSKCPKDFTVKKRSKEGMISTSGSRREDEVRDNLAKYAKVGLAKGQANSTNEDRKEKKIVRRGKRRQDHSNSIIVREQTSYNLVAQKLKELEMMDKSNVDHVLDIEEVFHHYSRLTCPAYREIVDKFFMEMYSELFILQGSSSMNNLRPRLRTMKC